MESASQLLNPQCRLHFCGRKQKTNYRLISRGAPSAPAESTCKKRGIIASVRRAGPDAASSLDQQSIATGLVLAHGRALRA